MEGNDQKKEKENNTWEEIGAKFTALGESLTEAVEDAWNDPKTQDVLENIRSGLQQAADEIEVAIENAKEDPGVKKFSEDATQAFNDLGEKGEEVVQNVRPHVVSALKSFTDALNSLISDIEKED